MTHYQVFFAPEVSAQLSALESYIAETSGFPVVAAQYVDGLLSFCESLSTFPERGNRRDDLLPGLRVVGYRKHTNVAFLVDTISQTVSVVGIFHGGQDYGSVLTED